MPPLNNAFVHRSLDRNHIVSEGKRNAKEQDGSEAGIRDTVLVKNKYTEKMIEINNHSIRHGLGGKTNYLYNDDRLGMIIGDTIKNGIPINQLTPSEGADYTYAIVAYAVSQDKRPFLAIAHIDIKTSKLVSLQSAEAVHSLRGRTYSKEKGSTAAENSTLGPSEDSLPISTSTIILYHNLHSN